jgi:peptidoglycan/LPS O-acetylase OafA/YrhL
MGVDERGSEPSAVEHGVNAPTPGGDDSESPLDHRAADLSVRGRTDRKEIPSLHGLRAVAILIVIVGHAAVTLNLGPTGRTALEFLPTGGFGVNVFFVLSGFLITRIVMEYSTRPDRSLKTFYVRRALRLIPALYVFVGVTMLLGAFGAISLPALAAVSALLFFWDYTPWAYGVWWLGHTWSLSIEEQFYILWAPTLRWAGVRRARWIAGGLIVLVPVVRVVEYFAFPVHYLRIRGDSMLHTRADVLMVGCLLALLWDDPRTQRVIGRVTKRPLLVLALVYLVLSAYLDNHFHGKWAQPVGYSLDAFAIGFVMVYAVSRANGALGRILNSRWMVQIGLMSYSLYLWQQLFLTTYNHSVTGQFPLNLVCTALTATLSYYLVEIPFLNLRRRVT